MRKESKNQHETKLTKINRRVILTDVRINQQKLRGFGVDRDGNSIKYGFNT